MSKLHSVVKFISLQEQKEKSVTFKVQELLDFLIKSLESDVPTQVILKSKEGKREIIKVITDLEKICKKDNRLVFLEPNSVKISYKGLK